MDENTKLNWRSHINYTQNGKIEQVTDTTLVIGVDVGSQFTIPEPSMAVANAATRSTLTILPREDPFL